MTDEREVAARLGPHRVICDDVGRFWTVREIETPGYDRRMQRSLLFDREEVMRRLNIFPQDWHDLSDADLYALSLLGNP